MKTPTPQQRHAIYMKVLARLKADKKHERFMCNVLCEAYEHVMYSKETNFSTKDITALFPEFVAQKPQKLYHADGDGDLWWDFKALGHEKIHQMQINVLLHCLIDNNLKQGEELIKRLCDPEKGKTPATDQK